MMVKDGRRRDQVGGLARVPSSAEQEGGGGDRFQRSLGGRTGGTSYC